MCISAAWVGRGMCTLGAYVFPVTPLCQQEAVWPLFLRFGGDGVSSPEH